jgi:hypothetical protein
MESRGMMDITTSEPLLSSQHPEDDPFDPLSPVSSTKPPETTIPCTALFRSKYVIACALFASIGGLIFGYGIPSLLPPL